MSQYMRTLLTVTLSFLLLLPACQYTEDYTYGRSEQCERHGGLMEKLTLDVVCGDEALVKDLWLAGPGDSFFPNGFETGHRYAEGACVTEDGEKIDKVKVWSCSKCIQAKKDWVAKQDQ